MRIASSLIAVILYCTFCLAQTKMIPDDSKETEVDLKGKQLLQSFATAINSKDRIRIAELLHPKSKKCYQNPKNPSYYDQEFDTLFKYTVKEPHLKEFRKHGDTTGLEILYPTLPTHFAILNVESKIGEKLASGIYKVQIRYEQEQPYYVMRCY